MTSRQAKLQEDIRFQMMRTLQKQPDLSQIELAEKLGIRVVENNHHLKALIKKGLIKMNNFANLINKYSVAFALTPNSMAERITITQRFLKCMKKEFEALKFQMEVIRAEVEKSEGKGPQNI